jgi:hypothetical protein
MRPSLRKLVLTLHITFSVGWLGVVVAYLALAIGSLKSQNEQSVRVAYVAMEVIGWYVIIPFSLATLLVGLVQALGTEWGLFRHYWVLVKFVLALVGTAILLVHMPSVSRMAAVAASTSSLADLGNERLELAVHAVGGLVVLLAATVLSIYKPWGRTAYGLRIQRQRPKKPSRRPPQRMQK